MMAIEILSPRLANQIAAGEVVERPASVVKELVENAIDAGATEILIEIEQGGAKLISIRDNGCGVVKEQLGLALSRHATSKISTLDDLEAIDSLGFRGEALASISSVCRLTFTSKTQEQPQAWQAYAQGRDMAVEVIPASHPQGTTVAVADMFFNTPARRRFLRTEKTEFTHIDELVKRFALSHFDIAFTLKHNGKVLRNLMLAKTTAQQERRVSSLCGKAFIDHAIAISSDHNEVKISGWLALPQGCKSYSDNQYCYVNGRMMRDKLINHAIRQAYQDWLPEGLLPGYIIYIEIAPSQVDVNVHPAKHEVRFHQARMVHDLIFQVLNSALNQTLSSGQQTDDNLSSLAPITAAAEHGYGDHSQTTDYGEGTHTKNSVGIANPAARHYSSSSSSSAPSSALSSTTGGFERGRSGSIDAAASAYQSLMSTPGFSDAPSSALTETSNQTTANDSELFGQLLTLIDEKYLVVNRHGNIELLSLTALESLVNELELTARWAQGFKAQPLLLPVAVAVDGSLIEQLTTHQQLFRRLGIEISVRGPKIIVKQVPAYLRQQDIATVVPQLLQLLANQPQLIESDSTLQQLICHWLAQFGVTSYSMASASQLVAKAAGHSPQVIAQFERLLQRVDFSTVIADFND